MTAPRTRLLTSVACLVAGSAVLGGGLVWAGPASHAVTPSAASASSVSLSGPEWSALTPAERKTLQPLADQWRTMDANARDKWVNVADRYSRLSPDEQQRVQARMNQWSTLQPKERGEARLRFQQTRQLSAEERQQKWEAYKALPDADRDDLTRQARRKAAPVFLPDNLPGPREPQQAFAGKRQVVSRKNNVVPGTLSNASPSPTVVAPTLVKAGQGATTSLVTKSPTPPLHQQTGLPKITATKGFVDPVTLLPRKGAQSAAMASSLPTNADASQTYGR